MNNNIEDKIINIKARLSELEIISVYGLSFNEIEERQKLEKQLKKLEKEYERNKNEKQISN